MPFERVMSVVSVMGRTQRKCILAFVAAMVVFVGAGCSGGAPPQTTPSAGDSETAPARPARDPAPDGAAADAQDTPASDAADTPAFDAADTTSGAATAVPVVPISDAAAAEQGPGFALPSVPGTPAATMPPPADSAEQGPGFALPSVPGTPAATMPPPADSVELIDRLVAIVGDTAILLSEVREQLFQLQAQGIEMPNDPQGVDSLANATLQRMIEELMIVQQAEFAGIEVTEEELDDEVDRRFAAIRARFSSDQEMLDRVEASGQNMFQFRQLLRSQVRKDLLGQRYMRSRLAEMPPIRITEQEIQAEFNSSAAGSTRPATLSMVQIRIEPKPGEVARDSALQLAQTALEELRSGEDFEVVARRYSDDEGSRAEGGDLGWIRRSDVLPVFGDAAWAIRLGVPIGPVETRYGFHIIKVENVRGGERLVRHILTKPYIGPEQVESARSLAQAVADSIAGGADPTVMARRYGVDPDDARMDDVRVDRIEAGMGAVFATALRGARSGDVVGPFEVSGPGDTPAFVVLDVIEYRPSGGYDLEELRVQIRDELERRGQYEALIEQVRQEVYIRIMI